ncbi:MAG: hypothetical protein R2860_04005 [Desulfobacterales bacterium]
MQWLPYARTTPSVLQNRMPPDQRMAMHRQVDQSAAIHMPQRPLIGFFAIKVLMHTNCLILISLLVRWRSGFNDQSNIRYTFKAQADKKALRSVKTCAVPVKWFI